MDAPEPPPRLMPRELFKNLHRLIRGVLSGSAWMPNELDRNSQSVIAGELVSARIPKAEDLKIQPEMVGALRLQ